MESNDDDREVYAPFESHTAVLGHGGCRWCQMDESTTWRLLAGSWQIYSHTQAILRRVVLIGFWRSNVSENSYWRSTHAAIHLKGAAVRSMVEPNFHVVFSVSRKVCSKFIHISHIFIWESPNDVLHLPPLSNSDEKLNWSDPYKFVVSLESVERCGRSTYRSVHMLKGRASLTHVDKSRGALL